MQIFFQTFNCFFLYKFANENEKTEIYHKSLKCRYYYKNDG